jgi:gas vesicle protein
MTMNKDSKYGILGFLAGAVVGAAAGVLLAPDSGKETRKKISKKAKGAKEDMNEYVEKARVEWSKTKGKMADTATMTKEEVADFATFLMTEYKDLKKRLKKDVEGTVDEVVDRAKKNKKETVIPSDN